MGRVEQLGDAFVGERVGLLFGGDEAPGGVVGVEAARPRRVALGRQRGQSQSVLVRHRVHAHGLEHLERQRAVVGDEAPEAHHASCRPHLVRAVGRVVAPPGEHQIDLFAHTRVGEQGVDGPVARLGLLAVEALSGQSFRSVDAHTSDSTQARMRALSGSYIGRSEATAGTRRPATSTSQVPVATNSFVIGSSASSIARPTAPPRVWP